MTRAEKALALIEDEGTVEKLAASAHASWIESNRVNGITTAPSRLTGEEQMRPYAELSELVKEYDRRMARGVMLTLRTMLNEP